MAQALEAAAQKVSALDPDFLLILFVFAMPLDAMDILLEPLGIFILPKVFGMVLDGFAALVIGGWMYWRTGEEVGDREERGRKRQRYRRKIYRVLRRVGLTLLAEVVWLLGLLPFWTITVILTLRQK